MGGEDVARLQQLLQQLESLGEDIISDRQEVVSLDRRRNTNREALRALRLSKVQNATISSSGDTTRPVAHSVLLPSRVWACVGNMFIRIPRSALVESIEEGMNCSF